ncbi:hypothetical protein ABPG74_018526 [Tetrahymena malaccensis]
MINNNQIQEALINDSDTVSQINSEDYHSNQQVTSSDIHKRKSDAYIIQKISFDEALKQVGAENWYQIRAFLYFSMQWFFAAWILLGSQFILFPAQFDRDFCGDLSDEDCQDKVCKQEDPLSYMTNRDTSMIGTFNLVCDNTRISIIQSVPYLGSLIGFFLFSWIADNKGRRIALGISWLLASLGALLLALSWDYYSATVGFFIAGFGVNPAITVQLSLLSEHSIGKIREYTTIGVQVFYGIGECVMVGIAYAVPDWRHLTLYFLALPMLLINLGIFLVYESPKFVYERNTFDAFEILNKIANVNKKESLKVNTLMSVIKEKSENSFSVIHLFKYPSLRMKTIFSCLIFFSIQAVYYGVTFAMSKIGLDLYKNTIIISSAETLAYLTTDHFIPKIKRKWTTLIGLVICCVLSLCYQFLKTPSDCDMCTMVIIQIVFAAIIRFSICFVWTVVYMYMTELFPTVVKSLALGIISASGTIGSTAAPYIGNVSTAIGVSPMISLGVLGLVGVASTIPLKETLGQPLQNQIEEMQSEEDKIVLLK